MKYKKGIVRIGTSNIVVPGNQQTYPPAYQGKSRLNYYSSFFNSLEVNSSFYKVPMAATFKKWSLDVPDDFQFTVKLFKEITHAKELNTDLDLINNFLNAANQLGNKKGCLLVQFPGKISIEYYSQVESILSRINDYDKKKKWRIAVEFRHASWYCGETFELMDAHNASLVLHDIPKGRNADVNKKAEFVFIRFHGPTGDYRGSYSDAALKEYADKIQNWLISGKDVYAYFNNTMGSAFDNARTLRRILNKEI
ncbi:MAG: DUF72 domain-containing protein [Ferruginibacter sp.]